MYKFFVNRFKMFLALYKKEMSVESQQFACTFCKKCFSSRPCMLVHQRTAKYCLQLQGNVPSTDFACETCGKQLTTKPSLLRHTKVCKNNLDDSKDARIRFLERQLKMRDENELQNLRRRNELLEEKLDAFVESLKDIAKRPTSTTTTNNHNHGQIINNNNTTNNTLNLTETDHIRKILDRGIPPDYIALGQQGFARYVVSNLLTGDDEQLLYRCVDVSRNKFKFLNQFGNEETDVNASKLSDALSRSGLHTFIYRDGEKLWTEDNEIDEQKRQFFIDKILEIDRLSSDNTRFVSEIKNLTA